MSAARQAGVELCEMKIAPTVFEGGLRLQCVCPGDYYPHIPTPQR